MRTQPKRTFRNPVIPGFHPDPSICRVAHDFFLVTSSFEYFPGIPIFHSRDLVHWRQIGHVLTRPGQLDLRGIRSSGGIYAPTIRHARGRYYVITTHVGGGGNFYVTARRPEGPWSDPVWLDRDGIDPSLLFDGGEVYYTRNGLGRDFDHPFIYQTKVDVSRGDLLAKQRPVWSGMGGIWPEGPHLYRVGTTYYLLTAEGGTAYGHSVIVARSSTPFGPFEPCPTNPVATHRHRRYDPVQAVGHADLVALPDGTWWAVLLGIRPRNGRHHHLGRETFLVPVTWTTDGWPVFGRDGRVELELTAPRLVPAPVLPPPVRDDFDTDAMGPEWTFVRNPNRRDWSLRERSGHLRLRGSPVTLDDVGSPAAILRRQQHFDVRCRTVIEFRPRRSNEEAGVTVRANENFRYDLALRLGPEGREVVLRCRLRGQSQVVATRLLAEGPVELEVTANADAYAFRAGPAGRLSLLGSTATRALSAESIMKSGQTYFTGVCIGLYASGNGRRSTACADFDWFEYAPLRPKPSAPAKNPERRRVRERRPRGQNKRGA
jgi:xylan 1,4-beta-xylosidase